MRAVPITAVACFVASQKMSFSSCNKIAIMIHNNYFSCEIAEILINLWNGRKLDFYVMHTVTGGINIHAIKQFHCDFYRTCFMRSWQHVFAIGHCCILWVVFTWTLNKGKYLNFNFPPIENKLILWTYHFIHICDLQIQFNYEKYISQLNFTWI